MAGRQFGIGGVSTARKDLRGTPRSALQMLFGGGRTAAQDLNGAQPRDRRMLFGGGKTAAKDLRTDEDEAGDLEMLAEGGEADGLPDELHIAGEDVMAAFKAGKPEDLTRALYSFISLCESQPHDEEGGEGGIPMDEGAGEPG